MTSFDEKTELNDSEIQQLLFFLNDAVENIRFAKKQQWNIGYYVILLYAAMLYVEQYVPDNSAYWHWPTIVLTLLWASGIFLLWKMQYWMKKYRQRLKDSEKLMAEKIQSVFFRKDDATNVLHGSEILLLLTTVLTIGFFISLFLMSALEGVALNSV